MSIYVFNMLVGYEMSGVDIAQGYRANLLQEYREEIQYIYTEVPSMKEISRYYNAGIQLEEMHSAHQFFTDHKKIVSDVTVDEMIMELKENTDYIRMSELPKTIKFYNPKGLVAVIELDWMDKQKVNSVYYFKGNRLIEKEYYTDGLYYVEYFKTAERNGQLYAQLNRRSFMNQNGSVAFEQIFKENEVYHIFPDGKVYTAEEFIGLYIQKLAFSQQDIVIMDRAATLEFVQPLFQYANKARLIAVLHSGHYFEKGEDYSSLYLNYEYYTWFKYSKYLDTMVVSTWEQKQELKERLKYYHCSIPNITVIPAGGIHQLYKPKENRRKNSLISVSRLMGRKRIDWAIRSVILAHEKNPDITFDIYGKGEKAYEDELKEIVKSEHAEDYIRFMGQQDVKKVYCEYEVFLSTSLWETLGLSVMEAIGSGNAMIGLDVKYGNRLFIQDNSNGYLVDFDSKYVNEDDTELISHIADKIVEIFSDDKRLEAFHQKSYHMAENFLGEEIKEKWIQVLGLS